MKKLILSIVATVLTVLGLSGVAMLSPVYAANTVYCGTDSAGNAQWATDLNDCKNKPVTNNGQNIYNSSYNNGNLMGTINTVINVIIGLVGLIAVVVIVIGGINFITSQGDSSKVTKARNTILYGVVGLVVALLAFAIVNFVLGSIF